LIEGLGWLSTNIMGSPLIPEQRDATDQVEEIQRKLTLKESDLTRIRAQREDFRAEASELKAKELDKMKSVEEVTRLNQSGKERIEALGSEVRRLKMSLAARRGDGETVDLLLGAEEVDVIRDLQERLK
jgi:E3 ubiquitin-protein ligase BRE1